MALSLREPASIVSKYLRSSPARQRPPRSPSKPRSTPTVNLAKFHDMRASTEEQEDFESDIEVLGPFPAPSTSKTKNEDERKSSVYTASVKAIKDSGINSAYKSLHPIFLQKAMENVSISKPTSTSSRGPRWTSTTKRSTKSAPKLAKSVSSTSVTSVDSEPSADLPTYSYKDYSDPKPYVVYTRDVSEADDLIGTLRSGPVALDMEWCFSRVRNAKERRTAVVQVADLAGMVIIVHLSEMPRFPKVLQTLIEDPKTPKLGANIMNDGKKLFRDYGIIPKNLLELGVVAAAWDPEHAIKRKVISLAKLAATYTQKTLLKGDERISDWEVSELSELQKDYAANDVHCSLEIYKRLCSLSGRPDPTPLGGADVVWHVLKDTQNGDMTGQEMRLQWRRAHKLWYEQGMQIHKMCAEMRVRKEGVPDGGPLKTSTVISYVVSALQADPELPFDVEKLRQLVQMDAPSWERHRLWVIAAWFRKLETHPMKKQGEDMDLDSPCL
ncbi:hypothetical protein H0H87_000637 [Tephrocybe sp. NHM501043]|nr:hypothetical protein H0H87_000637 [Tephrocybe sp. NHM501043]